MRTEGFFAHPAEVQIWAVRTRPPAGFSLWGWADYLAGLVIRAMTLGDGGRYSHLLLRQGETIWEAGGNGVREGRASEYSGARYAVDVYAAPLSPEQASRIVAWARRTVGTPYDWPQLLRIAVAEMGQNPDWLPIPDFGAERLICSEFVALAHRQAGVDLTGGTPLWRWTPDDVRRCGAEFRGRLVWTRRLNAENT